MRTQNDLQRAFALLENLADETDRQDVRPAVRTSRTRWLAPLSVAAAVAVGAAAISLATHHDTSAARSTAQAASSRVASPAGHGSSSGAASRREVGYHALPLNQLVFSVDRAGTRVAGAMLNDENSQVLDLTGPDGSYEVTLYSDAYPVPVATGGMTPAPVNGHAGFYGKFGGAPVVATAGIAWQYAPHAWATLRRLHGDLSRATAIELASSVDVQAPTTVQVPVSFAGSGAVLDGWNVSYGVDPSRAGQHGDWAWNALFNLTYRGRPVVLSLGTANVTMPTGTPDTHVGSAPAFWRSTDNALTVVIGDTAYSLDQFGNGQQHQPSALSEAQLVQLAERIQLADHPADPSTWFPATTALP